MPHDLAWIIWLTSIKWLIGVTPHLPGFLHTVNPSIAVSDGAKNMYYLCSMTSFLLGEHRKNDVFLISITDTWLTAFVVTLILGYVFPIAAQKDFINSNSRTDAQVKCEEFILGPTILNATEVDPSKIEHVLDGDKGGEKA